MNTTADRPTGPAFVVFGIGADKKPRAARFDDSQPKLVAKAAELMNLKLRKLIRRHLPTGETATHWSPVRQRQWVRPAGSEAALRDARRHGRRSKPERRHRSGRWRASRSPELPRSWDEIAPGHLVIANEGIGDGWWEAIVVEVKGDMLTLHWRDYPWQPDIIQHR